MKKFYVGIKGVIIKEDKVLLLHAQDHVKNREYWEVPGGRIDNSETIQQALSRELKEEVPNILDIQISHALSAFRLPWDVQADTSLTLIFYKVTAQFEGNPIISHEHTEYKWATKKEALELVEETCFEAIERAFSDE